MPRFIFTIVPQLTVQAPDLASAEEFIKGLDFESGAIAIKRPGSILVPGQASGPKRKRLPMACIRVQEVIMPGEEVLPAEKKEGDDAAREQ